LDIDIPVDLGLLARKLHDCSTAETAYFLSTYLEESGLYGNVDEERANPLLIAVMEELSKEALSILKASLRDL